MNSLGVYFIKENGWWGGSGSAEVQELIQSHSVFWFVLFFVVAILLGDEENQKGHTGDVYHI